MQNKNFKIIYIMLISIILLGTFGYSNLLNVSILDGLYMTVITISSVGYKEVAEMTDAAKLFSIVIIFLGVGTLGYALTNIALVIVEGNINHFWRKRRMEAEISKISNHIVICGAGETGEVVINELKKSKTNFVVIEKNEERYKYYLDKDVLIINGDATEEEVLERANIKEAAGLISILSTDVDNVFVVLTSRTLNRELYIISRSIDKHSPDKLKKAGANKTISANEIGGRRMAAQILSPSVVSFLEVVTSFEDIELDLQDVVIEESSEMIGKTLKELKIPDLFGLVVIAVKKLEGNGITVNPKSDLKFNKGDIIFVLGNNEQANQLRDMANDYGKREF